MLRRVCSVIEYEADWGAGDSTGPSNVLMGNTELINHFMQKRRDNKFSCWL